MNCPSKRPAIKWKIIRDLLRKRGRVSVDSFEHCMTRDEARQNLIQMKLRGEIKRVKPATRRFRKSLGRSTGRGSVYILA